MQVKKIRQGYALQILEYSKKLEIPSTWQVKKINHVCKIVSGSGFPLEYQKGNDGEIPFIKVSDMNSLDDEIYISHAKHSINEKTAQLLNAKITPPDTIIFPKIGATIFTHKRALLKKKSCFDNNIMGLIPKEISSMFLFYLMDNIRLENYSQTTALPYLDDKIVGNLKIPYPELTEQEKIASILSNVDSLINHTSKEIEQTKKLKKGLMQRLLTRGIGHKKFKKVAFGQRFTKLEIPEEWEVTTVIKLSNEKKDAVITGPFGLMLHSSDYVSQGTPMILIKNIQDVGIDDTDIPKIKQSDVERLSRYKVQTGDMVFSRVGRVGSSALIEKKHNGWLISGQLLRIRFNNKNLNSYYVNYFFHSFLFNQLMLPQLLGTTRDSINTEILKQFSIIIPPKNEQDEIVKILDEIETKVKNFEYKKSNLESLKKGLMQKLLTGQIRVKV